MHNQGDVSEHTPFILSDYEQGILMELEELHQYAQQTKELKYVITRDWTDRIKAVVSSWGPKRRFSDGGYNFYRILAPPLNDLTPEQLEKQMYTVAQVAAQQNKQRTYRKTRSELQSKQNNQILASLFEINVLSRLLEQSKQVTLYPQVGDNKNQDVEASIDLDGRNIFIEAKALGYSKYDPKGRVGSQSVDSLKKQVRDALADKLEKDSHLAVVAPTNPTILCLALGFNADEVAATWAIEDFLPKAKLMSH